MGSELSAADVLALAKDNDGGWVNNPFIYLVWLAILGGGSWFGNRNDAAVAASQGALTRAEMYEGFNNQDVNNALRGIESSIGEGTYAINNSVREAASGINANIVCNSNAIQSALCGIDRNIDSVKAEAYKNTCAITNAIHSEGEQTRALIQANTIQDLRDRLADSDRDLLTANFQLSQQAQSANLISQLRPFPIPAYQTCSPYTSSGTCGCTLA